jgi:integrase
MWIWGDRVIAFHRAKTGTPSLIRVAASVETLLKALSSSGPLFPTLRVLKESRRSDYFRKRCASVGISGISLHSYRYAWAERAKQAGYP